MTLRCCCCLFLFFFSSRRRHTRCSRDWSSDVCSSDLTLWLPGMDHAGISTQLMVTRQLKKEGLSRHDLGREKFIERVWQWKQEYGGQILNQIRREGASVDWSRFAFTMDEDLSRAVRESFVRLYEDG